MLATLVLIGMWAQSCAESTVVLEKVRLCAPHVEEERATPELRSRLEVQLVLEERAAEHVLAEAHVATGDAVGEPNYDPI